MLGTRNMSENAELIDFNPSKSSASNTKEASANDFSTFLQHICFDDTNPEGLVR